MVLKPKTESKASEQQSEIKNTPPVCRIRKHNISVGIWKNTSKETDKEFYTATLSIGFKRKDATEYENKQISLFMTEISDVILVLQEALRQQIEVTE